MISIPSILLLNCVGSYFYTILEHLNKEGEANGALLFFARGYLRYREISSDEVKKKANANPWGYQPVGIETSGGELLEVDDEFFAYMERDYYLKIERKDAETGSLIDLLRTADNNTSFLIFTVDEYYLEKSDFYAKMHNKHFLLVKNTDYENEMLEVIDSERNFTYSVPFSEMSKAVYDSCYKKKTVYCIDASKYENHLNVSYEIDEKARQSLLYVDDMIADIRSKNAEWPENIKYFYKGYYYNFLSKIAPYYFACAEVYRGDREKREMYTAIAKKWKNLSKSMYLVVFRHHEDAENLIGKIERTVEDVIAIFDGEKF